MASPITCEGSASSSSSCQMDTEEHRPYRATQLWCEVIKGFRSGMPRKKKWLKMRLYEDCFTGTEAAEWLLAHLQDTGMFGLVARQQVEKLLHKFLQSDVIEEVRGKLRKFNEDSGYLYRFVTEPGPFNFLEEEVPCSPLGKRTRSYEGTFITNEYAFMRPDSRDGSLDSKRAKKSSVVSKLAVFDVNTQSTKLSPSVIAGVWKELTLARLLQLVELSTLDLVLAHDAVDGKHIEQNVKLVSKIFMSKTTRQRQSQASSHDAVSDVPHWVILAMRSLSKWPHGCTEEFVGGMPIYCGFEMDVLQSLVKYFAALPEPLISPKLYDLHMAVLNLIRAGKLSAVDATQLCSLLLPQTNRMRVHRVLRLIKKAGENSELRLSTTQTNLQVLLDSFSTLVIRPSTKSRCTEQERKDIQSLVAFMADNYQHIFKVPDDLKEEVEKQLQSITSGKADSVISVSKRTYCARVSQEQYTAQTKTASQTAIAGLLDSIMGDENMSAKVKKQRLKQFQKEYPEIYAEKFPSSAGKPKPKQALTVFSNTTHVLR